MKRLITCCAVLALSILFICTTNKTDSHAARCGFGRKLYANTWAMISPPCKPDSPNTLNDRLSAMLPPGSSYGTNWIVYAWDSFNQKYVPQTAGSPLTPGDGAWIYSTLSGGRVEVGGTDTSGDAGYLADCASYDWSGQACYPIALEVPPSGETRWNMIGHPFIVDTAWADARIAVSTDNGSSWTNAGAPTAADTAGYISKTLHTYNNTGSAYESFEDGGATPGALKRYQGYWLKSKYVASVTDIAVLIPGPKVKKVFVAPLQPGDYPFSSIGDADQVCMNAASGILPGTFKAWISGFGPGDDPDSRFTKSTDRYVNTGGDVVAENWSDLTDGTINVPLQHGADGYTVVADIGMAITGTRTDGTAVSPSPSSMSNCSGWSSGGDSFYPGSLTKANNEWTHHWGTNLRCDFIPSGAGIYCFEQ